MKNLLAFIVLLNSLLLINSTNLMAENMNSLHVSKNGRFLIHKDNSKFFPLVDTAWKIAWRLNRDEVDYYLQTRKEQKFNTITLVVFPMSKTPTNVYGYQPFEIKKGKYDPLKPIIKTNKYDYWDHLEYIIDGAAKRGIYVILLPAWGSRIAGDWGDGHPYGDVILNIGNVSNYAYWISHRFKNHKNIIWMIGGDRSAVYGKYDYRAQFRAMAAGVLAGNDNQPMLMSYHPRKWKPNSSEWFHNDKWLSFNSVQDEPSDQIKAIEFDYNLSPPKPTWLFEGGYEKRRQGNKIYTDWQMRLQSYQTVFAGGFGIVYGHTDTHLFGEKLGGNVEKLKIENNKWEKNLHDPGTEQMQYLIKLMTLWSNEQYLERIPDQSLIDGDTGKMTGWQGYISSVIQATRGSKGDYAMIYSANGRNIRVNMNRLAAPKINAYWYNPRNGKWNVKDKEFTEQKSFMKNIPSGKKAPIKEFDPPGKVANGNDWVLVLEKDQTR